MSYSEIIIKMNDPKTFIDPDNFSLDSFRLGKTIYNSGYIPTKMVGVWRWGAEICFRVDEFYRFKGYRIPTFPVKSEHYDEEGKRSEEVKLFDVESLKKVITGSDDLLIIDEVEDSGESLGKIVKELKAITPRIKTATLYYKPEKRLVELVPDFYLHETSEWLVWPGELENLTMDEIKQKSSELYFILTT